MGQARRRARAGRRAASRCVEHGALRVLATIGYEPEVVATYEALPLDAATPLTDLLRVNEPMRTGRQQELIDRYPALPHSSLSASFAGIPLEFDGRIVGVMALSSTREDAFPEDDFDFPLTLARQCAQALERGRLFAAEREARRRTTFLAMASSRLAESLDYSSTLDAVAALAVPATGDWCSIHLLDDAGGAAARRRVHHRDPELQDLLTELFVRYPPEPGRGAGIGQARRRAAARAPPRRSPTRCCARSPATTGTTTRCGGSASAARCVVPLEVVGRVVGVLTITSERPRPLRRGRHRARRGPRAPHGRRRRQRAALPPGARDGADPAALAAAQHAARRCPG